MKVLLTLVLVFAVTTTLASQAQELDDGFQIVDQTFHSPSKSEIEKLREMVDALDQLQAGLERYAYRCEALLTSRSRPERFVFIHAVDKEQKAVRHIVPPELYRPGRSAVAFLGRMAPCSPRFSRR